LAQKQVIVFNDSALEPSFNFIRNRSVENLENLVSQPGSKLAHAHYCWANPDSEMTVEEFWSAQLSKTSWSHELQHNVDDIKKYVMSAEKKK
jgi:hypothetical protein